MEKENKILVMSVFSVFIFLFLSSFVTSGFFDDLKASLTGKATSQAVSVNVSIGNTAPKIDQVIAAASVTPLENTFVMFQVNFTAVDADGTANLKDASSKINFTRSGTTNVRQNSSCSKLGNSNATRANYTCAVQVWYFDTSGLWNISVLINDTSDAQGSNTSASFTVNQLQAFVDSPSAVTFNTITPGGGNVTSSNDPILLNNTGNYNVTVNTMQINATDLKGETTSTQAIYAGNMSVSIVSGGSGSNAYECYLNATNNNETVAMSKSVYTNITNASLDFGNNSLNDNITGQRNIFFCIDYAGSELSSQAYSTLNQGSWTIKIAGILLTLGGLPRFTRKEKKNKFTKFAFLGLFGIFSLLAFSMFVSAAGVSAPYWDTPGNENPLIMHPGETKDIQLSLQNMVGDQDLVFKTNIVSGKEIISILDKNELYPVPAQGTNNVNLRVTIPKDSAIGNKTKVRIELLSSANSQDRQITLGSGYSVHFDVIVAETPKSPSMFSKANISTYLWIIGIIALIVIIYIIFKKKSE